MDWQDWVTVIFLALGCFLDLTGAIGILRMPDFYSRLHPAGKSDTLAQFFIVVGLMFQVGDFASDYWATLSKLVLIALFMFLTTPLATHAITKAAHLAGLQPWTRNNPREGVYLREKCGSVSNPEASGQGSTQMGSISEEVKS